MTPLPRQPRRRAIALPVLLGLALGAGALGTPRAAAQAAMQPATADAVTADKEGGDTASSRNAARSRLRECGHQWSSMKKTGSASGMTWKDFSQGCLARK